IHLEPEGDIKPPYAGVSSPSECTALVLRFALGLFTYPQRWRARVRPQTSSAPPSVFSARATSFRLRPSVKTSSTTRIRLPLVADGLGMRSAGRILFTAMSRRLFQETAFTKLGVWATFSIRAGRSR